jgi:hypothetical protein
LDVFFHWQLCDVGVLFPAFCGGRELFSSAAKARYQLADLPGDYAEIADWSATALLVENDNLWVGLARRPEGAVMPGGLARIDRRSGKVTKFDVAAIIHRIVRWNRSIYMGTSEGIFVLSEGKLNHLSVAPDLNGRYRLITR